MKSEAWQTILSELGQQPVSISDDAMRMVHSANRIFVAGAGRSGLAIKAFAMRIGQLGKPVTVVGETSAPAFTAKDLLIVATGSGSTQQIVSLADKAHQLGGVVWLLTATPATDLANRADNTTLLPGKAKFSAQTNTIQPMGSLFEQAVLIYGDAFALSYMQRYAITESEMQAHHANLE